MSRKVRFSSVNAPPRVPPAGGPGLLGLEPLDQLVERGGYGTVYRARDKQTGTLFALKFIPLYRAREWAEREG
ncbi:MAG: hypothetical protein ACXU86_20380, partial [Archangium sp.]